MRKVWREKVRWGKFGREKLSGNFLFGKKLSGKKLSIGFSYPLYLEQFSKRKYHKNYQ